MSELRVDTIKNQSGTGSPIFSGVLEAGGFKVSGSSGFLKADGTVDSNTYLSSSNIGNGTLTFAVSGTGLTISSNPTFGANQSSNKTVTVTLSSSSSSTANTIVSRDASSNTAVNKLTATTVESTTIQSSTFRNDGRILAHSTLPINNKTPFTSYVTTPALSDGSSAQFAVGITCLIASNNNNPAAFEFYKTRADGNPEGHQALADADGIGGIHFSGSDGVQKKLGGSIYCNATANWNTSIQPTTIRFVHNQYLNNSSAPYRETMMIGKMLNATDTIGASTIYLPYVLSTSQSANASFDSSNRLVKQSSSIKYKHNIEDIGDQYAYNVLKLRPVWYKTKNTADRDDWSWYGLIAEEVAEVEPRLTFWGYNDSAYDIIKGEDGLEQKKLKADAQLTPEGVQYDRISVLLLKVVKDQQKKIEELENKINSILN